MKRRKLMSSLPPRLLLSAAALLLAGSGVQVCAQFDTTTMTNDFLRMQNLIITQGISRENLRSAGRHATGKNSPSRPSGGGGPSSSPGRGGGSTKSTTTAGPTTFRPVAGQLVPQELARTAGADAQERAKYERFFTELLDGYKERLRRRGSPENDVSRAASFLISESYYVYRDGRSLTEEQFAALAAQVREALSSDAGFAARTDREKQQMYERYAIKGSFLGLGYTLMKQNGDAKTLAGLRELAKRQLEEMLGSRAEEISFTSDGVEYR